MCWPPDWSPPTEALPPAARDDDSRAAPGDVEREVLFDGLRKRLQCSVFQQLRSGRKSMTPKVRCMKRQNRYQLNRLGVPHPTINILFTKTHIRGINTRSNTNLNGRSGQNG